MPRLRPLLAKLTRPRLHHAVEREAVFARLDEGRATRSAICVVGPPGAGKTTVVASWLDARAHRGIWYQVDAGDADLATFFHYLGEAARPFARRGQRPLPALTPEYLGDIAGFARRFFRALFDRLPGEAVLVLDNYQEVEPENPFHALVADAVSEVPEGQMLVAVSRRDPPDCYARLVANERVGFVDAAALRLTLDETRAIVAQRALLDEAAVRRLHERCGGWAAGLTLMLEGRDGPQTRDADMERVFDYFAGQFFGRASLPTQRFLVETSMLPDVPVGIARALTGNQAAAEILEDLYRRHLFVHRRPGPEAVYWYHALFREFLAREARRQLPPEASNALACRAAGLLQDAGRFEEAFSLFAGARDWASCARVILGSARRLLALGRWRTLADWLEALPTAEREREPRLAYWLGVAWMPANQQRARALLEDAFRQLEGAGDRVGQALAAAAIIDTVYFEWSRFQAFHPWIAALIPLLEDARFDAPEDELHVQASLLIATLFVAPGHPVLFRSVDRVEAMLGEPLDANSRIKAASHLLAYCGTAREVVRSRRVEALAGPLLADPAVTPFNRMWWHLRIGQAHAFLGQYESAATHLARAEQVQHAEGLSGLRTAALLIASFRLMVAGARRETRTAAAILAEVEALADAGRATDMFLLHQTRVRHACLVNDPARMHAMGPALIDAAERTGMTNIEVLALLDWCHALAALGDATELGRRLARVRQLVTGTCLDHFEVDVRLLEACARIRSGATATGREQLGLALELARRTGYTYANQLRISFVLPELLAEAIEAGIERDYVRAVIRRYRILPAADAGTAWPWPVRIRTFGRFELLLDDEPVAFAGKAPRRVLALLKAIVALGVVDVPVRALIDALWPDMDGDAGYDAFTVTVGRLRKLLGAHEIVTVAAEKVSLDTARCWIDTVAFHNATQDDFEGADLAHILELYGGPFLPEEADAPWALRPRLKFQQRFLARLESLGAGFEAAGDWARAANCYDRGLAADDLAEGFYQGLMRCHLALGRSAEGLSVFRRLRQTLSVVLGVGPSHASLSLARRLGERAPPP